MVYALLRQKDHEQNRKKVFFILTTTTRPLDSHAADVFPSAQLWWLKVEVIVSENWLLNWQLSFLVRVTTVIVLTLCCSRVRYNHVLINLKYRLNFQKIVCQKDCFASSSLHTCTAAGLCHILISQVSFDILLLLSLSLITTAAARKLFSFPATFLYICPPSCSSLFPFDLYRVVFF